VERGTENNPGKKHQHKLGLGKGPMLGKIGLVRTRSENRDGSNKKSPPQREGSRGRVKMFLNRRKKTPQNHSLERVEKRSVTTKTERIVTD